MRAKEYIFSYKQELKQDDYVSQAIKDLLPTPMDKSATEEHVNTQLIADIRFQHYLLQKELFKRGNVMQTDEPSFSDLENEVSMDIASSNIALDKHIKIFQDLEQ